jgi:hypothetical protein
LVFVGFPLAVYSAACATGGTADYGGLGYGEDSGVGASSGVVTNPVDSGGNYNEDSGNYGGNDSGGSGSGATTDSGSGSGSPTDSGSGSGSPTDSGSSSGTPVDSGSSSGTPKDSGTGSSGGTVQKGCNQNAWDNCVLTSFGDTNACVGCCQQACSTGTNNYIKYVQECVCGTKGACTTQCKTEGYCTTGAFQSDTDSCATCVQNATGTGGSCDTTITNKCNADVNCVAYLNCAGGC